MMCPVMSLTLRVRGYRHEGVSSLGSAWPIVEAPESRCGQHEYQATVVRTASAWGVTWKGPNAASNFDESDPNGARNWYCVSRSSRSIGEKTPPKVSARRGIV